MIEKNIELLKKIEEQENKLKEVKEKLRDEIKAEMNSQNIKTMTCGGKVIELVSGRRSRKVDYDKFKTDFPGAYKLLVTETLQAESLYIKSADKVGTWNKTETN